jgi:nitrous oxidase accessory protein
MNKYPLIGKCLAVGIILLFIGTAIIPTSGQKTEKLSLPMSRGNTLYVGGSGPGNYTKIQDAVDNASTGDTVFVYRGVYYENIIVNKSISLMGENRSNTFIWNIQPDNSETILISSDNVSVSRFGIFNSSCSRPGINILSSKHSLVSECNFYLNYQEAILVQNSEDVTITKCHLEENNIFLYNTSYSYMENCSFHRSDLDLVESESNLIANCIFQDTFYGITMYDYSSRNRIINCSIHSGFTGIVIYDANYEQIKHCEIIENRCGVYLANSSENEVSENTIESNYPSNNQGLAIYGSKNNTVTNNIIHEEKDGIILIGDNNTTILKNTISNNTQIGLNLSKSMFTSIRSNNFEDNKQDAYFFDSKNSIWRSNYWGRIRFLPKPIFGILHVKVGKQIRVPYIWINFDWHPAQQPYDISGMR